MLLCFHTLNALICYFIFFVILLFIVAQLTIYIHHVHVYIVNIYICIQFDHTKEFFSFNHIHQQCGTIYNVCNKQKTQKYIEFDKNIY